MFKKNLYKNWNLYSKHLTILSTDAIHPCENTVATHSLSDNTVLREVTPVNDSQKGAPSSGCMQGRQRCTHREPVREPATPPGGQSTSGDIAADLNELVML